MIALPMQAILTASGCTQGSHGRRTRWERSCCRRGRFMSVQPTQLVHVVLIKATRYDDDGYPMRHWRGVLPSNTLACLAGLTDAVQGEQGLGAGVEIRRYMYDEAVQ